MIIVHVHVHVKDQFIEAFQEASIENARHSIKEAGITRFDVIQQADDLSRFLLIEIYKNEASQSEHKQTPHYARWRDAVSEMMAEPRTSVKYQAIFPFEMGK